MFNAQGIRASELAAQLAELIEKHGDCRMMVESNEFPEDCRGVRYNPKADSYYRKDTFVVH